MRPRPGTTSGRRFALVDALVLIAATGTALAMLRGWMNPSWCRPPGYLAFASNRPSAARSVHYVISLYVSWSIPFGITFKAGILTLRLRPPIPAFRAVATRPGAVACAAALVAMPLRMSQESLAYLLGRLTLPSSPVRLPSPPFVRYENPAWNRTLGQKFQDIVLEAFPFFVAPSVSIAVLVAWCVLWANGRWRPEPCWIDRSGRLLGIYWLMLGPAIAVLSETWKFVM